MSHVVVLGCGVVGAAIAYELSQVPGLTVTVLDKQPPAQGATGAALGVLMGAISHKTKGKAWRMRQDSIKRYETLIPELEAITGRQIPFNRQGILMLCFQGEDLADWQKLVEIRQSQGWHLELWDAAQLQSSCPHLNCDTAVYSPQDRQVEPVALTLAMVEAAQHNGVNFHFGVTVEKYELSTTLDNQYLCGQIQIKNVGATDESPRLQNLDWLVVAAGLGSLAQPLSGMEVSSLPESNLTSSLPYPLLRPVLGQALHLQLEHPLGRPDFQPVITGNDVHIVPMGGRDYWVGATVEFPTDGNISIPDRDFYTTAAPASNIATHSRRADVFESQFRAGVPLAKETGVSNENRYNIVAAPEKLQAVMQQAIAFCPPLAKADIVKTWSGLRPRPAGRPAPIIENLPGFSNILLATGHYRNGVLLAPATAQMIRQMIAPSS